jgi:hypothetical protein
VTEPDAAEQTGKVNDISRDRTVTRLCAVLMSLRARDAARIGRRQPPHGHGTPLDVAKASGPEGSKMSFQ